MHTFFAVNLFGPEGDLEWSDLMFTGPDAAMEPVFVYDTHEFIWNTAGSRFGTYTASVKVTGPFFDLNDTATLTINLIPEPTSITLAGLLLGLTGLARRRV